MKTTKTTKETTEVKETYKGICNFCHAEFDKSKMTQHLKHCKQRKATIEAANAEESEKTNLFHIVVEGRYLPMYWMHLEMPADATLLDLDDFLRAIWLECCDHLSEFRIGKDSYSSPSPAMMWDFADPKAISDEETDEDEDEEDDAETPALSEADLANLSPFQLMLTISDLLAEEFDSTLASLSATEFQEKLADFLATTMPAKLGFALPPEAQAQFVAMAPMLQSSLLADLNTPQEYDMDVELGEVLKVGLKFTHEYDFGSTTYLALRVVGEREGAVEEDEDGDPVDVTVMARNEPPVIPCRVCGEPATKLFSGYYSVEDGAVCDKHARPKKDEYEDSFLPVVNSPRVGVCGYTGDYEFGEEWDEDEDEEDEEDEGE